MKKIKNALQARRELEITIRSKKDALNSFAARKDELSKLNYETAADMAISIIDELTAEIHSATLFAEKTDKLIAEIPDPKVAAIMKSRYIDRMTWEAIAEQTQIDISHAHRLHSKGLKILEATRNHM